MGDEHKNEEKDKESLANLKQTLKKINRERPRAFICGGSTSSQSMLKLLSKVNESINVVLNMGKDFFTFWILGSQYLVLNNLPSLSSKDKDIEEERHWFYQEMKLSNISQNLTYVFVNVDVKQLPKPLLQKMSYGKVTAVFGC